MKHVYRMKRVIGALMCLVLMLSCTLEATAPVLAASETYKFTTTDVRAVISAVLAGTEPDTDMGEQADRDGDGDVDTTDARLMLQQILSGDNVITLLTDGFRLSSISDLTDSTGTRSYDVIAPYTDTYTLSCSNATSIAIYRNGTLVGSGTTSLTVSLEEGKGYTLTVKTSYANTSFELTTVADNHQVTLPYDVAEPADTTGISLSSNANYTIAASPLNYQKREGGTYVYCNNPEQIASSHIGSAFLRNEGLTDDVYVTFEHSNISGRSLYLGYQLKNEGTEDVYVTVTNVGYQTSGSWYGQLAWYDFYNTSFQIPSDASYNNSDYLFQNYTPRVFRPITYRLPAGQAFYVVGGTTSDAYRNINVDGTANLTLASGSCANACVKFNVTGGSVTGTLYAYTRTSQVAAEPAALGYCTDTNYNSGESYGLQYKGIADHAGVIDNYISWTFNDNIGSGMLPVSYTNEIATNASSVTTPYAAYSMRTNTFSRATDWYTHINPQLNEYGVGTDMVEFSCYDTSGNARVIDNSHADGTGAPANTGNWMIEYQDHYTLVNQGNKDRTITLWFLDNGALALLARDSQTGEVLTAAFPVGGDTVGYNYSYDVVVPAHSVKQITMDYLLMPMSSGSVGHMATIN